MRDCSAGGGSAQMWPQLTSLKCLCNSIPAMDASLATLPAVQTCDLSSNNISIVQVKRDPIRSSALDHECRCGPQSSTGHVFHPYLHACLNALFQARRHFHTPACLGTHAMLSALCLCGLPDCMCMVFASCSVWRVDQYQHCAGAQRLLMPYRAHPEQQLHPVCGPDWPVPRSPEDISTSGRPASQERMVVFYHSHPHTEQEDTKD